MLSFHLQHSRYLWEGIMLTVILCQMSKQCWNNSRQAPENHFEVPSRVLTVHYWIAFCVWAYEGLLQKLLQSRAVDSRRVCFTLFCLMIIAMHIFWKRPTELCFMEETIQRICKQTLVEIYNSKKQEILQILCDWLKIWSTFSVKFSSKRIKCTGNQDSSVLIFGQVYVFWWFRRARVCAH